MLLRRSAFVHLLDLPGTGVLVLHAVSQLRLSVTPDVARLIAAFDEPAKLEGILPRLCAELGAEPAAIRGCVERMVERGVLTLQAPEAERAAIATDLGETYGRDPAALLDHYRRARMEGAHPDWAVATPLAIDEGPALRRRVDILLLGDCDVQMESDFLRREARRRGIDLRVAASFAADTGLAAERRHDAVVIGALQARHAIVLGDPEHHEGDPSRVYVDAVAAMVDKLRALTQAPILVDGLPEPTVQPLGFADRGVHGHRNRFRATNLALARLAETLPDVHLVDSAAALGQAGSAALLDDGLVSFTHFGSRGWMLQRPASEMAAVHHQFPDRQPLADELGGDPYQREAVMARAHVDALAVVLALDRKKCVIVDLDGVLWPGVLAETGAPFAWSPDISGPHSFVGLYFGIHEALRCLHRRGILLACVSKNDEATVRALWRYGQPYPRHRLLSLDHFVCTRINWNDKAANIQSIADELGFALDAFLFIDDSARERERIRQGLPQVEVLGEDLFSLRRTLLTDPRLQTARVSEEASRRSTLVKAQLDRTRLRAELPDEAAFIASLQIECDVHRLLPATAAPAILERIAELIARTTQFNATGLRFALDELRGIVGDEAGRVFILRMRDRLTDHGLVGVAVVVDGEIRNVVLSCRVIGLRGEAALLRAVVADATGQGRSLRGRIVATDRNAPARHLYAANGFSDAGQGWWTWAPHAAPSETWRNEMESAGHA